MTLLISDDHRNARSLATIAFADVGVGGSYILLQDVDGTVLVTIQLTDPCGTLDAGVIRLTQVSATGDQIVVDGVAVKAIWYNQSGQVVAEGTVSDAAGTGDFKISSAAGTSLYAGGYVILGITELS